MSTLVRVFGKYTDAFGNPGAGYVTFTPRSVLIDTAGDRIIENGTVKVELDFTGSLSVMLPATDAGVLPLGSTYHIIEQISGANRSYDIPVPIAAAGSGLDLVTASPVPSSGGVGLPAIALQLTPGSYLYQVPPGASFITWEAFGGGGGGGAGGKAGTPGSTGGSGPGFNYWGGGGGGGAGRTTKTMSAADLRAIYPAGVPYTVGAGGAGGVFGNPAPDGTAGGFTFAGDFIVATPGDGGLRGGAGDVGITNRGVGGTNGSGDTYGCVGGLGGGLDSDVFVSQGFGVFTTGGEGGFAIIFTNTGAAFEQVVALGGGGGGGGGGGISFDHTVIGNGGATGIPATANTNPLFGSGGIAGGTGPTSAGPATIPGTAYQGGGGGGAASLAGTAQTGAIALANSGSGGGGGGYTITGTPGNGGNGGSGYMRIIAQ